MNEEPRLRNEIEQLRNEVSDRNLIHDAVMAQLSKIRKERDELATLLVQASESIGNFVSDLGWTQSDMDTMDSIDAALAKVGKGNRHD